MPWHIGSSEKCPASKPYAVIKDSDGSVAGCHPTKKKAKAQMAALYSQVDATGPALLAVPPLCTVPGVEVCAAGTWKLSTGESTLTTEDFAHAISAVGCPAVGDPVIKLGHVDPRFDGEPAVGRITNLGLAGPKLIGDYTAMPGWLGPVIGSAYPQRSIEGSYDFVCQIGHTHPFVITAVALLGVASPGVGVLDSLASVAELYGVTDAEPAAAPVLIPDPAATRIAAARSPGRPWTLEVPAVSGQSTVLEAAGVTVDDVRRMYYDSEAGKNYNLWICEMQLSPPQLIICDDSSAKTYRVPIKISGSDVTFSDPVEVEVEYVDVAASVAAVAAARAVLGAPEPAGLWASAEESRAGLVLAWSGAAAEKNLGTDPSASAIKKLYALPGATKSDSKLPHHAVSADGTVGEADPAACSAAIAALNGGRGGAAVSEAERKTAYSHLAAHLKAAGKDVPELAAAGPAPVKAAAHGPYTGTHSHPHAAMGSQGGDVTHDHPHTHSGDAVHAHVHAGTATTEGAAEMEFSDEQMAALRARLGKGEGEEITAEELFAAVPEKGTPISASALPAGTILLDRAEWEEMKNRIKKGEDAHAAQVRSARDAEIDKAIAAGKFSVARRGHWERVYDADPAGTKDLLATLTPGVVPVSDIGQPGGPGDAVEEDPAIVALYPPGTFENARG
jgi:hypothetical protein